jgi:ribonuclease HI
MAAQNRCTKEAGGKKLANFLQSGNGKIKLVWTPGHARIVGNELADIAAKQAANSIIEPDETL